MIKFYKLLLLLLLSTTYAFGQAEQTEDYLVTAQGDTLKGKVRVKDNSVYYDGVKGSENRTYTADDVKMAFSKGRYYASELVSGQRKLLKALLGGSMSLYSSLNNNMENNFYIKRNDTVYVMTKVNYPGLMYYFLSGCENSKALTAADVKKKFSYNTAGMMDFISHYNTCKGLSEDQGINYVPNKQRLKPVLHLGADAHQFEFGDANKRNAGTKFSRETGFVVGASVAFGKEIGFSFRPGLQFTHRRGRVTGLAVPINTFSSLDLDMKANFLELPALVRYTLPGEKVRPYLSFGPHVGLTIASKIDRTPHGFSYNDRFDERSGDMGIKYGISGGAGVIFPKVMKGMEIEARLDRSYYEDEYDIEGLQSTSAQIVVGFYLR